MRTRILMRKDRMHVTIPIIRHTFVASVLFFTWYGIFHGSGTAEQGVSAWEQGVSAWGTERRGNMCGSRSRVSAGTFSVKYTLLTVVTSDGYVPLSCHLVILSLL